MFFVIMTMLLYAIMGAVNIILAFAFYMDGPVKLPAISDIFFISGMLLLARACELLSEVFFLKKQK